MRHLTFIRGPSDDPPFEAMLWGTLRWNMILLVEPRDRVREAMVSTQLSWLLLRILCGLGVELVKETLIYCERWLVLLGAGVLKEA